MEVGADVSLSTEVSAMMLAARRRTGGPVKQKQYEGTARMARPQALNARQAVRLPEVSGMTEALR
ncbi:hypothetical protein [Streptomyces sp. AB3(2024)]|uniref:hypothetical protein n=1 Tax=Streptomyces sp. AB3(2024) TaxID=3317321 RepID=UPI0035A3C284